VRVHTPSNGPNGSVVRLATGTRDEEHYVRLRGAFHRLPHHIGSGLHQHQSAMYQLLMMHRKMMLFFGAICLGAGIAAGHFIR
jgi:hypothetical protein